MTTDGGQWPGRSRPVVALLLTARALLRAKGSSGVLLDGKPEELLKVLGFVGCLQIF